METGGSLGGAVVVGVEVRSGFTQGAEVSEEEAVVVGAGLGGRHDELVWLSRVRLKQGGNWMGRIADDAFEGTGVDIIDALQDRLDVVTRGGCDNAMDQLK